jgi:hypothetical protein
MGYVLGCNGPNESELAAAITARKEVTSCLLRRRCGASSDGLLLAPTAARGELSLLTPACSDGSRGPALLALLDLLQTGMGES